MHCLHCLSMYVSNLPFSCLRVSAHTASALSYLSFNTGGWVQGIRSIKLKWLSRTVWCGQTTTTTTIGLECDRVLTETLHKPVPNVNITIAHRVRVFGFGRLFSLLIFITRARLLWRATCCTLGLRSAKDQNLSPCSCVFLWFLEYPELSTVTFGWLVCSLLWLRSLRRGWIGGYRKPHTKWSDIWWLCLCSFSLVPVASYTHLHTYSTGHIK